MGGGSKYTFGKSQSAINLMSSILCLEEYKIFKRKVCSLLSKQSEAFHSIMTMPNKRVRGATLKMWHERFAILCEDLPELVKTHTRCVETGLYRQFLKGNIETGGSLRRGNETAID